MAGDAPKPVICRVLELDTDLAEALPSEHREQAARECIAELISIRRGTWIAPDTAHGEGIGLLLLEGMMIRRVGVDGRHGSEVLGSGDLLRPWQDEGRPRQTIALDTTWHVLEASKLAVLDEEFSRRAARFPQLSGRLVGRAIERSRNLAVNMAVVNHPRVDVRLHILLWHLAARWGRVRSDGVLVRLPLTHNVLAELTAARRPTVSTALSELGRRGVVRADGEGWLLLGPPPGELLELTALPPALSAAIETAPPPEPATSWSEGAPERARGGGAPGPTPSPLPRGAPIDPGTGARPSPHPPSES